MEMGDEHLMIGLFEDAPIRSTIHDGRWFFSVIDVIAALTDSPHPSRYLSGLRDRLDDEGSEIYAKCVKLRLPREDGSLYKQLCADTHTLLRIVQSVPSPKAEPFKLWLAEVGEAALASDSAEEHERRIERRKVLHLVTVSLNEEARARGCLTKEQMHDFKEARYFGLYGMSALDMQARAHYQFPTDFDGPEAYMGSEELADNLFVEAQTRAYIHKHDVTGAATLIAKHEDIGVETRLTIERIGGTLPEHLPTHRRLGIRDVLAIDGPDSVSSNDDDMPELQTAASSPALAPGKIYIDARDGRAVVCMVGNGAATNWEQLEIEALVIIHEQGGAVNNSGYYACPSELAALAQFATLEEL